jgi:hypothetical protein
MFVPGLYELRIFFFLTYNFGKVQTSFIITFVYIFNNYIPITCLMEESVKKYLIHKSDARLIKCCCLLEGGGRSGRREEEDY